MVTTRLDRWAWTLLVLATAAARPARADWVSWNNSTISTGTQLSFRVMSRCKDMGTLTGPVGMCKQGGEAIAPVWIGVDSDGYLNASRPATVNPPPSDSIYTATNPNYPNLPPGYTLMTLMGIKGPVHLQVAQGAELSSLISTTSVTPDAFALMPQTGGAAFLAEGSASSFYKAGVAYRLGGNYDATTPMNVAATTATPFNAQNQWNLNAGPERNITGTFMYDGAGNLGGTYQVYVWRPTLTASVTGGAISGAGLSCSSSCSCSAPQYPGASITLTATPTAGYHLVSWGGACAGTTTGICTLPAGIMADASASVTFSDSYTLSVVCDGGGGVTAGAYGCPFSAPVPAGSTVVLTNVTGPALAVTGWTVSPAQATPCTSLGTGLVTCSVLMNENRSVTVSYISTSSKCSGKCAY